MSPTEKRARWLFLGHYYFGLFRNVPKVSWIKWLGVYFNNNFPSLVTKVPAVWRLFSTPAHTGIVWASKKYPEREYPPSWNMGCCSSSISWKSIHCHKGHRWISLWTWNNQGEWNVLLKIISVISWGHLPLEENRQCVCVGGKLVPRKWWYFALRNNSKLDHILKHRTYDTPWDSPSWTWTGLTTGLGRKKIKTTSLFCYLKWFCLLIFYSLSRYFLSTH